MYVFNDYCFVHTAPLLIVQDYIMNDSIHLLHPPLLNRSLMFLAGWLTILHLHPILPQ